MALTILRHRQADPDATLADGPVLEIIHNVQIALDYVGEMRIGPKFDARGDH